MKKGFLKPFAATVATMLAASNASAATAPADAESASFVSSSATELAGGDMTIQRVSGSTELAAHGSHASHSSHASHASHSSHASSSF